MSVDSSAVQRIDRKQTAELLSAINQAAPWDVWATKLASRKRPEPILKLFPKSPVSPLEWSLSLSCEPATMQLIKWLSRLEKQRTKGERPGDWNALATEWLETVRSRPQCESLAIECIAWAAALPRLAIRLTDQTWAELFAELVNVSVDAMLEVVREDADGMIESQLLAGELPLTLGYTFPKIETCRSLGVRACAVIDEGLLRVLDGEGMPHSDFVPAWHRLLACWTRCVVLNRGFKAASVSPDALLQFEWLVRQTLRWRSGTDRLPMTEVEVSQRVTDSLIKTALEVGGDQVDVDLFEVSRGKLKADDSEYALPQPGEHSEWSELAIFRANWNIKSPHLTCSFSRGCLISELSVGGFPIWAGNTMPDIRIGGKRVEPDGEFSETCWCSDEDVDYLELEVDLTGRELSGNWRLQRQIVMGRADSILLVADVVLGDDQQAIEYRLSLPLKPSIEKSTVEDHAEVQWSSRKHLAWVMPLALSEWKIDRRLGTFDGQVLRQHTTGSGLYAPLFFDFDPKRKNKPRTWRQLTVVEELELLPADIAVAYRVQAGNKNWVVYRSLDETGNRTFIGQNLISEFLVAKLNKNGETETLVEIE